jgi:hypothetical protein
MRCRSTRIRPEQTVIRAGGKDDQDRALSCR